MKWQFIILLFCSFFLSPCHVEAASDSVAVKSVRATLRSGADDGSDAVCHVNKGQRLSVQGQNGSWLSVSLPSAADVWIYAELVRDGVVAAPNVRVRSGPGLQFGVLGEVAKGAKVTVRSVEGEWMRLAPTPGSRAWVSAEEVEGSGLSAVKGGTDPAMEPAPESQDTHGETTEVHVAIAPDAPQPPETRITGPEPGVPDTESKLFVPDVPEPPEPVQAKVDGGGTTISNKPIPKAESAVDMAAGVESKPVPRSTSPRKKLTNGKPKAVSGPPGKAHCDEEEAPRPKVLPGPAVPAPTMPVVTKASEEARQPRRDLASYTGTVRTTVLSMFKASDYQLVAEDTRMRHVVVCYLEGDAATLGKFVGKEVKVSGIEKESRGNRYPLLVVEEIAPTEGSD